MKPIKTRRIIIPSTDIIRLARDCRCSTTTVWNALAFRSSSEQARKIRSLATERYGGVETEQLVYPRHYNRQPGDPPPP
jgi:hypothetical protein